MSGVSKPLTTLDKRILARIQKKASSLAKLQKAYANAGPAAVNASLAKMKRRNLVRFDRVTREWNEIPQ